MIGDMGTCHAHHPRKPLTLIGEHSLENGLIGLIGHHALMQLLLAFMRLRGQDMTAKSVTANDFARPRLLETFGRTFVCLELRHRYSLDLFEQERLQKYSMAAVVSLKLSPMKLLGSFESHIAG